MKSMPFAKKSFFVEVYTAKQVNYVIVLAWDTDTYSQFYQNEKYLFQLQ